MRERFEREAQVLARLNHPNVIRLLNFYNLPHGCFIVLEFPEGETLEQILAQRGPVPMGQACSWLIQILGALEYAHQQGVVHRDVKPANIIISAAGVPKLLDFGLAHVSEAPRLTMQGLTLGTVAYMSREQLFGKKVDGRTDVYAVGVTLFELLTRRLPFEEPDERKLVLKITKQDPTPPSTFQPALPPELEKVILKALMKDRDHRFPSADEMAKALAPFADGASPSPSRTPSSGGVPIADLASKTVPVATAPVPPPPPPPLAPLPPPPRPTPAPLPRPNTAPHLAPVATLPPLPAPYVPPPTPDAANGGTAGARPRPSPPTQGEVTMFVAPPADRAPDQPPPPPVPSAPAPTPVAPAGTVNVAVAPVAPPRPVTEPVPAPVPAGPPSLLGPLMIAGACIIAGSLGLGIMTAILVPEMRLLAVAAIGTGLPIGVVLVGVAILQARLPGPPRS
jgi:serine/threonine-protein kinase